MPVMSSVIPETQAKPSKNDSEEDKELQNDLTLLVDQINGMNMELMQSAAEQLKFLIKTSTTSMTSVPKPLKFLLPFYESLKSTHTKLPPRVAIKKSLADIVSILAIANDEAKLRFDCLSYCLKGNMNDVGQWGHEYVRQLETEIVQQWHSGEKMRTILMPLTLNIVEFNCRHHAELPACDLLMEIDQLQLITRHITKNIYSRICAYLMACSRYVDDNEAMKIHELICSQYMKYGEMARALISSILMNDSKLIEGVFIPCEDKAVLYQLCFICARHLANHALESILPEEMVHILSNSNLSSYFLILARELDILEPKHPDDIYKTWLESSPLSNFSVLENVDSARQNLATSIVNGFINVAFGSDKLLADDGNWIYRNKEHGMLSATASLGLIYLWDVDGGLSPIDKYLYANDNYIKGGALLALGIVNARVRNECDPALALLGDYVHSNVLPLQIGAIFGIGLAYAGTERHDVLSLLVPLIASTAHLEILAAVCVSCGLISLGDYRSDVPNAILKKLIDYNRNDQLKSPFMRLIGLGMCLCYYNARDEGAFDVFDVFEEPFRTIMICMMKMCAYAGTGNVLVIQELLHIIGEHCVPADEKKPKRKRKQVWDMCQGHAMATLSVSVVAFGEEIGMDMIQRVLGHIGRYGEPVVRKVLPLAVAFISISNPQLNIMDILTKYAHDSVDEVACNAIFGLGIIGAGTNNARLAKCLRQLAAYHVKNPSQLFMVRIAQGLVHMGKGTMTLNPLHTDRQLLDPVGMAGLLVTFVALFDPQSLILNRSHYFLYALAISIQPRWLLTLDEELNPLPVTVRVGQAVDVVGKAGTPKTIAGIRTHTTPVLLAAGERAELAGDEYEMVSPTLDGICVLKKKIQ